APDALRGRISAVNSVFIGMSNELGSFESGMVAALLGPIGAVVSGGIGTLLVVAFVAWRIPQLRDLKRI
ncbi:MAG: MFS transporter, partial [Armatimonadetes bacterium]|nr:MFS transporter [Anaerolineae bacterium]